MGMTICRKDAIRFGSFIICVLVGDMFVFGEGAYLKIMRLQSKIDGQK